MPSGYEPGILFLLCCRNGILDRSIRTRKMLLVFTNEKLRGKHISLPHDFEPMVFPADDFNHFLAHDRSCSRL